MRAVQSEFLPPDPYADAPPAPQPASRPVFLPPDAAGAATAEPQNSKAVWALIFGSGSLGLLVFSARPALLPHPSRLDRGMGPRQYGQARVQRPRPGQRRGHHRHRRPDPERHRGRDWIVLIATGEDSTSTEVDGGSDGGVHFDVIRLVLTGG